VKELPDFLFGVGVFCDPAHGVVGEITAAFVRRLRK
jgi:hypothetical protein